MSANRWLLSLILTAAVAFSLGRHWFGKCSLVDTVVFTLPDAIHADETNHFDLRSFDDNSLIALRTSLILRLNDQRGRPVEPLGGELVYALARVQREMDRRKVYF